MTAIERQMRGQFPRAANRLFGKKENFVIDKLQSVLDKLESETDLSKNKIKNGVKPGGDMLAGRKYLQVYASYRNNAGMGALLSLEQDSLDSELMAVVWSYQVGKGSFRHESKYAMGDFELASHEYIELVKKLATA
jgi:hypothetical protein